MSKLTLKDIDLKGKKVLMRVDFNVPLKENGEILDDTRIKAALPSIEYILSQNASLILMSHLGRPKGKKDPKLSLLPVSIKLSELLNRKVKMEKDSVGKDIETDAKNLKPGQVILLENLRFYEAEEKPEKDPSFAKSLSQLGDLFINDAFGTAHRKHSSTYTITKYFPKNSVAGFLMEKEIKYLGEILENPKRPFFAIIGGKKISTKIGVIKNLLKKVDGIFIGGAMSFTFLKAMGKKIGKSIYEEGFVETAKNLLEKKSEKIYLPTDIVIADNLSNDAKTRIIPYGDDIIDNYEGVGIGPKTIQTWQEILLKGKTILWNGPLGVFEFPNFAKGTIAIAKILSDVNATKIIGGGDSVAAITLAHLENKFTHLSTGGGASLEYLEYGTLPGIEALTNK